MTPLEITDHATLRFIERVLGFDVNQVRNRIRGICQDAAKAGASSITHDGFTYKFSPSRSRVVTVVAAQSSNRKGRR